MWIAMYVFAYLIIGAVSVKVSDHFWKSIGDDDEKMDTEMAGMVFILWPLFALAGLVSLITQIFVPDIWDRDPAPRHRRHDDE